jgi:hypothetical protein
VKVALAAPAATLTLAGTEATEELLLESATEVAVEAAPLRTTVPSELSPPIVLVGLTVREETVTGGGGGGGGGAGVTVSAAVWIAPPALAVILTVVETVTGLVVIVKFALLDPAAMLMVAGTEATVSLLLESSMDISDGGAPLRTTMP